MSTWKKPSGVVIEINDGNPAALKLAEELGWKREAKKAVKKAVKKVVKKAKK